MTFTMPKHVPACVLQNTLNDLEGWRVDALVHDERRLLVKLGTLRELTYALGQIACLLAAHFKQRETGLFAAEGVFSREVSVADLHLAVAAPDSPLGQAVLHDCFKERWPELPADDRSFMEVAAALTYLVRLVFLFRWQPLVQVEGSHAESLKRQLGEALAAFNKSGLGLHNHEVILALHDALDCCHVFATFDIEPAAA